MVQASRDLPKLVDELIFGVWGEKGNKGNKDNKWYRKNCTQKGEKLNQKGKKSNFGFILYTIPERDGSERKFAMLYLAPKYYNDEENDYDDRKVSIEKDFESKGVKLVEFPFYCTFTEEVISHYFLEALFGGKEGDLKEAMVSEEYKDAHRKYYGKEGYVKTPGWHDSPYRIHRFNDRGIDRFERELKEFKEFDDSSKKIYEQIICSIAKDYSEKPILVKNINRKNNGKLKNLINSFEFDENCSIGNSFKESIK